MTSEIDICNRALSEIGTRASMIASFDESSVEAQQCGLWYDNLRRGLLRSAPWGFARAQVILTQLGDASNNTSPFPWLWKYEYPADTIKFRYVLAQATTVDPTIAPNVGEPLAGYGWQVPSRTNRYIISSDLDEENNRRKVLLSNVNAAIGVYTADITNPDLFDDGFESALTSALAFKLCVPLSGNIGMRDSFAKSAERAVLEARAADANESIPTTDHVPDWIETRGVGGDWGSGNGNAWGDWACTYENLNWSS